MARKVSDGNHALRFASINFPQWGVRRTPPQTTKVSTLSGCGDVIAPQFHNIPVYPINQEKEVLLSASASFSSFAISPQSTFCERHCWISSICCCYECCGLPPVFARTSRAAVPAWLSGNRRGSVAPPLYAARVMALAHTGCSTKVVLPLQGCRHQRNDRLHCLLYHYS